MGLMRSSETSVTKNLRMVHNISEERRSRPRHSRGSIAAGTLCFLHNDRTSPVAHPTLLPAVPGVKLPVRETGRLGFARPFPPYVVMFCCVNMTDGRAVCFLGATNEIT